MKKTAIAIGLALALALTATYAQENAAVSTAAREQAQSILKDTGVTGGLVVHVGCGENPALTLALRASDSFVVQGSSPTVS